MATDSASPTDTPLLAVLRQFEAEGFSSQFQAVDGGRLRCLTCRRSIPASSIDANRIARLEGASDPADMLGIAPVICPECDARGILVFNFGPEATVEEVEVLMDVERSPEAQTRHQDHPPA